MNIEQIRDYCLEKKAATESFPFDDNTLVFKVMGKMFASVEQPPMPTPYSNAPKPAMEPSAPSYSEEFANAPQTWSDDQSEHSFDHGFDISQVDDDFTSDEKFT